jgi:hypothetical protein
MRSKRLVRVQARQQRLISQEFKTPIFGVAHDP